MTVGAREEFRPYLGAQCNGSRHRPVTRHAADPGWRRRPAHIEWLRPHAIQLKTVEAGSGFEDLQKLKAAIGDARIVSLEESAHGTREIFQMKHRLVEYLASELGFTIFSIEANMPESYKVNDYVLNGKGDPKDFLKGMYFWTWNTEEVLAMIEWMPVQRVRQGANPVHRVRHADASVAMQIVEELVGEKELSAPVICSCCAGIVRYTSYRPPGW